MLCDFSFRYTVGSAALGLLLVAGCGSRGPVLHEVRGSVRYDGSLLKTGVVSLRGARGNNTLQQPTGTIESNGEYRIYTAFQPGAAAGWYTVVVFATEPTVDTGKVSPGLPKSLIPVRYNNASTSPLEFEVTAKPAAGAYDLTLEK